jgi:hypothetical protein
LDQPEVKEKQRKKVLQEVASNPRILAPRGRAGGEEEASAGGPSNTLLPQAAQQSKKLALAAFAPATPQSFVCLKSFLSSRAYLAGPASGSDAFPNHNQHDSTADAPPCCVKQHRAPSYPDQTTGRTTMYGTHIKSASLPSSQASHHHTALPEYTTVTVGGKAQPAPLIPIHALLITT